VFFTDISGSIHLEKFFRMIDISAFLCNPSELKLGSKRTQKLAWVLITCAVIMLLITTAVRLLHFKKRSKCQWHMVSLGNLPEFTANDVLRSFNSTEVTDVVPTLSNSVCKAVLPTGITVSLKKIG
jgi:hypothetical protein